MSPGDGRGRGAGWFLGGKSGEELRAPGRDSIAGDPLK